MSDNIDINKLDKFMEIKDANIRNVKWYLPFKFPMQLSGFAWFKSDMRYNRFPLSDLPDTVTQFVDGNSKLVPWSECGANQISECTAGGQIKFRTNSSKIVLQVEGLNHYIMDHMTNVGRAGFDVYCSEDDKPLQSVAVTRFESGETSFCVEVLSDLTKKMREYLIYFPLYSQVGSIRIGLDDDAILLEPKPWASNKSIVAYGTSIAQGGCATRSGMAYTNILSRSLNQVVYNMGFSGNGKGEKEIAEIIGRIDDVALYIIDYDWNIDCVANMEQTLPTFIDTIRAKHHDVPILVISNTPYSLDYLERNKKSDFAERTIIQQKEVEKRQKNGDKNIAFLNGSKIMGDDYSECMVDGCHATDLGFYRMASHILPAVKALLK